MYNNVELTLKQMELIGKPLPPSCSQAQSGKSRSYLKFLNEHWVKLLLDDVALLTSKQGMERFAFDTIEPPIEIDGYRLNRFIKILEKQNNPIANLTCGLLLEGQIETTIEIFEDCQEFDDHAEKRFHDAITFYTKAANEVTLKPIIEFLLRNLKIECPLISVQNRLGLYDLAPQDNFNFELYQTIKSRLGVSTPFLSNLGIFKPISESESTTRVQPARLDL